MLSKFSKSQLILFFILLTSGILAAFAVVNHRLAANQSVSTCQKFTQPFAYTQCNFDPHTGMKLGLYWETKLPNQNAKTNPTLLLTFTQLINELKNSKNPQTVQFAMNAGMYDPNFAPIGYTVIEGQQLHSLSLRQGGGNFHLMPNGVFWWDKQGYYITESQAMDKLLKSGKKPLFATQSGPMLVINGNIHPSFDPDGISQKFRNGVGISKDGQVKFVISDVPVNFYDFADLFKTQLNCDNALFLDGGSASALYSRELKRNDSKQMGVMLAVTRAD